MFVRITTGLMLVAMLALSSHAFPRRVMFEEFTGHG